LPPSTGTPGSYPSYSECRRLVGHSHNHPFAQLDEGDGSPPDIFNNRRSRINNLGALWRPQVPARAQQASGPKNHLLSLHDREQCSTSSLPPTTQGGGRDCTGARTLPLAHTPRGSLFSSKSGDTPRRPITDQRSAKSPRMANCGQKSPQQAQAAYPDYSAEVEDVPKKRAAQLKRVVEKLTNPCPARAPGADP